MKITDNYNREEENKYDTWSNGRIYLRKSKNIERTKMRKPPHWLLLIQKGNKKLHVGEITKSEDSYIHKVWK